MSSGSSVLPTDRLLVAGEEPPLGAHLVTPRVGFTHHGIYAGDGKVIHYGSLGESLRRRPVEEVSIGRFAHQHAVWIRTPRMAGLDRDTVIHRARSRVGEDRYSLFSNNCEHFCEWCMHGEQRSYQVERIVEVPRRVWRAATLVLTLLLALPLLRGLLV